MKAFIFNSLNDLNKKVDSYSEYIEEIYDFNKRKNIIITAITSTFAVVFILTSVYLLLRSLNNGSSLAFGFSLVLFVFAVASTVLAFTHYSKPPVTSKELGLSQNLYINYFDRDCAVRDVVRDKYGWLLNVKNAMDNSKVIYIKFLKTDTNINSQNINSTVRAVLFYENDNEQVIKKPLDFSVDLSTNKNNKDCLFLDFYKLNLTKYYSDLINTGVSYNLKTMEEYSQ